MPDRLTSSDVAFLHLEEASMVQHVGSVMILRPGPGGLDVAQLIRHVGARIAHVPRYRQRLRAIPGGLAKPVWVDDERFDLSYHVRTSALPRPGGPQELAQLVSRLQSRPLDRSRPLWELNVVEGLADDEVAVVTKVHQAMVDGVWGVDLGQVLLDDVPGSHDVLPDTWRPGAEPTVLELLAGAVIETVRRPGAVADRVREGAGDLGATATRTVSAVAGLLSTARNVAGTPPRGPLNQPLSEQRRFLMLDTDLADYRRIRADHLERVTRRRGPKASGPGTSVNDVVLAVLTGALRQWLLTRGEAVPPASTVRALVPMSVRADGAAPIGAVGGRVASLLVDLPTGEASPSMRLHQVTHQTKAHRETGQGLDAMTIAGLTGFAAPTLHALGARVAAGLSGRLYSIAVTNVPGPQHPLYLDGTPLLRTYPVMPLFRQHVLTVGMTSYDGGLYYGLTADQDAMPDLEVLAQCILDSLTELQETS